MKSINIKVNLSIVLVATTILAIFGYYQFNSKKTALINQLDEELKIDLDQLGIGLQIPLFNIDESTISSLLKASIRKKDMLGVYLWEDGKEEPAGFIKSDGQISNSQTPPAIGGEVIHLEREISFNNMRLGKVGIYATRQYIHESIRSFLISIILQILIMDIILVGIVMILLKKIFLDPVKKLTTASIEISSGNLDQSIQIFSRNDEIGILAKNFDLMRDSICNYITELRKSHDSLELKVQQRTLELQEANIKLEKLASTDGLTGITNYRHFEELFDQEWKRAIRSKNSISVIMIDVDFFKLYNDTYGHQVGDECLKKMANLFSETVKRPGDIVARYGGEEFIIILPDTNAKSALHISEKLRKGVESMRIEHKASNISEFVTISLGCHTIKPGRNSESLISIRSADEALYLSKKMGRNRVSVKNAEESTSEKQKNL